MFGSVNALFTGLAFAGLFYTIHLQQQQLEIQRDELRLQREEMKASREQLTSQAKAQNALVLATIGQMRVSAFQAKIEAIKMESESYIPGARQQHITGIREIAEQINHLAIDIEDALSQTN